jgi:hypothetical protein
MRSTPERRRWTTPTAVAIAKTITTVSSSVHTSVTQAAQVALHSRARSRPWLSAMIDRCECGSDRGKRAP